MTGTMNNEGNAVAACLKHRGWRESSYGKIKDNGRDIPKDDDDTQRQIIVDWLSNPVFP